MKTGDVGTGRHGERRQEKEQGPRKHEQETRRGGDREAEEMNRVRRRSEGAQG